MYQTIILSHLHNETYNNEFHGVLLCVEIT